MSHVSSWKVRIQRKYPGKGPRLRIRLPSSKSHQEASMSETERGRRGIGGEI